MLKKNSLGTQLIAGFTVIAVIGLIIGYMGMKALTRTENSIDEIGGKRLPATLSSMQMSLSTKLNTWRMKFLLNPNLSLEERQQIRDDIQQDSDAYEKAMAVYESKPRTADEDRAWSEFKADLTNCIEIKERIEALHRDLEAGDILNPDALHGQIFSFKTDHFLLQNKLIDMIQEGTAFDGGANDKACHFGRWLYSFETSNPSIKAIMEEMKEPHHRFHNSVKKIKDLMKESKTSEATKEFHGDLQSSSEAVFAQFDRLITEIGKARKIASEISVLTLGDLSNAEKTALKHLDQIVEINRRSTDTTVHEAHQEASALKRTNVTVMIIGFLAAILLGWFMSRSIVGPVMAIVRRSLTLNSQNRDLAELADAIAQGDLSASVSHTSSTGQADLQESFSGNEIAMLTEVFDEMDHQHDRLLKAFRSMSENLSDVMKQVQEAVHDVGEGAVQIADASQNLSQGATESAASVEEISASSNEVGNQASINSENAEQANRLAAEARNAAEEGGASMNQMVSAMEEINESSGQIARIIKVIDEIAFQTNLLALNAAVEAARAGKYGKGFAVVAEEVRNLAGRSAKAAHETAELIESSGLKVKVGTDIANKTSQSLARIVESITRAADIVGEIAASSREQATGMSQIAEGLGQIDSVIQQNTAQAEQTAASAQELTNQSDLLNSLVGRFKLSASSSAHSNVHTVTSATSGTTRKNSVSSTSRKKPASRPRPAASSAKMEKSTPMSAGRGSRMHDFSLRDHGHSEASNSSRPEDIIKLDDDDFGKF